MISDRQPTKPAADRLPSYRRRYTYLILALSALFIAVALAAYQHISRLTASSAAEAQAREQHVVLLHDAFSQLHDMRFNLHDYLLNPQDGSRQRVNSTMQRLGDALQRLNDDSTPGQQRLTGELVADGKHLAQQVDEIIAIRADPARWFPASRIIDQELQTSNTGFLAKLDALIAETRDRSDPHEMNLQCALHVLQKAWLHMVDQLHLLIANRFGAHAVDPADGMHARQHNVSLYANQVAELLDSVSGEADSRQRRLLVVEINELSTLADDWQAAYARLVEALNTPSWRHDLGYLEDEIEPLLVQMQQHLRFLRAELQSQAARQVDALSATNLRLGQILLLALGLMLLLAILGYFSLNRLILLPIRDLAESLKQQSHDQVGTPRVPPAVRETRDLVNAFDDMRAKVKRREEELDYLAHHDALTGLPNRSLFKRKLIEAIESAKQHHMLVGLLFLDLDRFKQINDSYGHATGDQMLIEISRRLLRVFRQDDMVARFGGDEFAILLENLHERDEMTRLAEKALQAIQRPYEFGGRMFYSGASIGIAVAPDDGDNSDRLIQLADAAMYAAKHDDGSSYRYVSEELTAAAAAQHALENELRDAIRAHRLELHFQPVVDISDGHVHSYESLLRWPHAEQGMLQPASFMNALADAGLCTTISDWALDQIQAHRPTPDSVLSINLSARLLHDDSFARRLFERIDEGRLQPDRLILEITEDTLETDLRAAARVLHELKRRGVRIALDDFGTGQASLSHLRRFPFDYIKIDQSFVAGIGEVVNDEKLIQAIIRLAHALEMEVVAEGVETEAQRDFLRREGCDYIQGYLVGRPSASG